MDYTQGIFFLLLFFTPTIVGGIWTMNSRINSIANTLEDISKSLKSINEKK